METRFDDLLYTIIQEKGQGIYGFLEVVMGFMYRRTDFFYEMAPGENMGFFPGQNEALIYQYFKKYQAIHFKERVPKRDIDQNEIKKFMENEAKKRKEEKSSGVTTKKTIGNTPTVKDVSSLLNNKEIKQEKMLSNPDNKVNLEEQREKYKHLLDKTSDSNTKEEALKKIADGTGELKLSSTTTTIKTEKPIEQPKNSSISVYNGDSCDLYNWSQGTTDVQIQIKLPDNTGAKKVNFYF